MEGEADCSWHYKQRYLCSGTCYLVPVYLQIIQSIMTTQQMLPVVGRRCEYWEHACKTTLLSLIPVIQ